MCLIHDALNVSYSVRHDSTGRNKVTRAGSALSSSLSFIVLVLHRPCLSSSLSCIVLVFHRPCLASSLSFIVLVFHRPCLSSSLSCIVLVFHRPCFGSHGLHQISAFPCTLLTIRAHTRTRTHVDCIATHTHTHAHMLTRMSKAVWNRSYSQRNKGYSPIYRIIIHKCNNTIPVCQIIFGV